MPELPEVETVRQVLRRKILNKKIAFVEILYDKAVKTDLEEFKRLLSGRTVREIGRVGKYLIFEFDGLVLLSHLRMEGKYLYRPVHTENGKHDLLVFHFDDDTELHYNDVRKFGTFHLKKPKDLFKGEPLAKLGPEPFAPKFTPKYLASKLKGKRSVKSALLDQTVVSGLGNIYVDEVLHLSQVHPETPCVLLNDEEIRKLAEHARNVLQKAISLGGTTIRSYYSDDNVTGRFQNQLTVHSRKGEKCYSCASEIIKIKVGGRGTYLCPFCQQKKESH